MANKTPYNQMLHLRLNEDDKKDFENRCSQMGRLHSEVLREMIVAFNDKRLTIKNDVTRGLYK